jgi:peptidoglycan/LPS O-acetylase OafA/YrhL
VNYTLVDIFFAGMITMTMCSDRLLALKKVLNMPLFKQIGVMSYCLYIFHYPIQNIVQLNFQNYFQTLFHNEVAGKLLCLLIALAITIPVVYYVHKRIELPFWKLRKYF